MNKTKNKAGFRTITRLHPPFNVSVPIPRIFIQYLTSSTPPSAFRHLVVFLICADSWTFCCLKKLFKGISDSQVSYHNKAISFSNAATFIPDIHAVNSAVVNFERMTVLLQKRGSQISMSCTQPTGSQRLVVLELRESIIAHRIFWADVYSPWWTAGKVKIVVPLCSI